MAHVAYNAGGSKKIPRRVSKLKPIPKPAPKSKLPVTRGTYRPPVIKKTPPRKVTPAPAPPPPAPPPVITHRTTETGVAHTVKKAEFWSSVGRVASTDSIQLADGDLEELVFTYSDKFSFNRINFFTLPKPFKVFAFYKDSTGALQPVLTSTGDIWYHKTALRPGAWQEVDSGRLAKFKTSELTVVFDRLAGGMVNKKTNREVPYSIEVKDFRVLLDIEADRDLPESDYYHEDILGNLVTVGLDEWGAEKAIDGGLQTFWKCSPQPVPEAIVNYYLDVRTVTDGQFSPSLIDKIYLDPLYPDVQVNVYTALDGDDIPEAFACDIGTVVEPLTNVSYRTLSSEALDFEINYIKNPNFEESLFGWTATGVTAVKTGEVCLGGLYSVKVEGNGTFETVTESVPLASRVIVTGFVRGSGTAQLVVSGSTGSYSSPVESLNTPPLTIVDIVNGASPDSSDTWQLIAVEYIGNPTITESLTVSWVTSGTVYIDKVAATIGDSIFRPLYFDGSDPGAIWEGTKNKSKSYKLDGIKVRRASTDYFQIPSSKAKLRTDRDWNIQIGAYADFNSTTTVRRTLCSLKMSPTRSINVEYDGSIAQKAFQIVEVDSGVRTVLGSQTASFSNGAYFRTQLEHTRTVVGESVFRCRIGETIDFNTATLPITPLSGFHRLDLLGDGTSDQWGGVLQNVEVKLSRPEYSDNDLRPFIKPNFVRRTQKPLAPIEDANLQPVLDPLEPEARVFLTGQFTISKDFPSPTLVGGELSPQIMAEKVWEPIYRDWKTRRGYLWFPEPRRCDFIKLEFTRLAQAPYPLWKEGVKQAVQTFPYEVEVYHRQMVLASEVQQSMTTANLGYQPTNAQMEDPAWRSANSIRNQTDSLRGIEDPTRAAIETTSNMFSHVGELLSTDSQQVSHYANDVLSNTTRITQETLSDGKVIKSSSEYRADITTVDRRYQETLVHMRFVNTIKHHYNVLTVERTTNYAYFVGLREVKAFRVSYFAENDTPRYHETFEDDIHYTLTGGLVVEDSKLKHPVGAVGPCILTSGTFPSTSKVHGCQLSVIGRPGREQFQDNLLQTGEDWTLNGILLEQTPERYVFKNDTSVATSVMLANSGPVAEGDRLSFRIAYELTGLSVGVHLQVSDGVSWVDLSSLSMYKGFEEIEITGYVPAGYTLARVYLEFVSTEEITLTFYSASLQVSSMLWEVSNDGGTTWLVANDVINHEAGLIEFPSPDNELVVRMTSTQEGDWVHEYTLVPLYVTHT